MAPTPPGPGIRLIVTADDFGAHVAVNEAVEEAYSNGVLTCASLMMGQEATADAVQRAHRLKGMGVGLHVTLADGRPVSSLRHVRGLVNRDGRFRDDLVGAGIRWFVNPMIRAQLAFEINSQFQAFVATGLVLDHVNVHKHLHLHPTIASLVLHIGRRYGMLAVRMPYEPREVLKDAEPGLELPRESVTLMQYLLRRKLSRTTLVSNDALFGLAWSGHMTEGRLLGLIPHLPAGLNELYMHPANADARQMPHAVPDYEYRAELQALLSPKVRHALEDNNITLARFSGKSFKGEA